MLKNLNPDLSFKISESLGSQGDSEPLTTGGNHSLISLVKRVVSLLSVPRTSRRSTIVLLPGVSSVLAAADWGTREVLIYNNGPASAAISLSQVATEDNLSYLLQPRILVVENFAGFVSAIADRETQLVVTIKS